MNAASVHAPRLPCNSTERRPALEIFQARAEARAALYAVGELDLHEAVDELQAAAIASGLVAAIGQDAVQALIAEAFGKVCHA